MADDPELLAVHKAVKEAARKIEEEGAMTTSIVDALLVVGINAAIRVSDKEHVAAWLKQQALQVRARQPVGTMKH